LPKNLDQAIIYEGRIIFPDYNVSGHLYNSIINKEGDTMDNEYIQEIFNQFHAGEIDTLELMEELETARFDGDIIDFL
jgi:hypothetical protein